MCKSLKVSRSTVMSPEGSLVLLVQVTCELYPSRHVALCLDPYCGLGFALWCLSSVYSGHHSILIPPAEVEACPALWLTTVSLLKGGHCLHSKSSTFFNQSRRCFSSRYVHDLWRPRIVHTGVGIASAYSQGEGSQFVVVSLIQAVQ